MTAITGEQGRPSGQSNTAQVRALPAAFEPATGPTGPPTTLSPTSRQKPVLVPSASLHDKVALITGASRGIGRGAALDLARKGASIVVNYASSDSAAQAVVDEINHIGNIGDAATRGIPTGATAIAIKADLRKVEQIVRLFEEAKKAMGRIDLVFSNSGMENWAKTEDITEEMYEEVFGLNFKAQLFVGREAWKHVEDGGRVVFMSSIAAGLRGIRDHALYSASKMAVQGLVASYATDFGKRGITVNAVAPGGVLSDMFHTNAWRYIPGCTPDTPIEELKRLMAAHCPLGRCATPEDVARVVSFLCGTEGGWTNGTTVPVNGGSSA